MDVGVLVLFLDLAREHLSDLVDARRNGDDIHALKGALTLQVAGECRRRLLKVVLVDVEQLSNKANHDIEISLALNGAALLSEHGLLGVRGMRVLREVVVHKERIGDTTRDRLGVCSAILLLLLLLLGFLHVDELLLEFLKVKQLLVDGRLVVEQIALLRIELGGAL